MTFIGSDRIPHDKISAVNVFELQVLNILCPQFGLRYWAYDTQPFKGKGSLVLTYCLRNKKPTDALIQCNRLRTMT